MKQEVLPGVRTLVFNVNNSISMHYVHNVSVSVIGTFPLGLNFMR